MSFHLIRDGKASDGDIWPLPIDTAAGGIPAVSSWRQWGHSWFAAGFDGLGLEPNRTRMTERIAGMMHLPPHAVANEAMSGAPVMSAGIGYGRVLRMLKPTSTHQQWPWECDRYGVEAFGFGVNDIGTGGIQNSGSYWTAQATMWNYVLANTYRSVIQRAIAGAVYFSSPGSSGLSPAVWRNPGPVADFSYLPKGPGGVGIGRWQYKLDSQYATSDGYWWTDQNGDQMVITVPVDYDTGTIALRYLAPGSYFDGPVEFRNPFGTTGGASQPHVNIRTGAEHPRAPTAVTVTAPGYSSGAINCQGLANRMEVAGVNPGPGVVDNPGSGFMGPGAMTMVSRHALTPTPGDTITVTMTVGGLPAGGWIGFDSWEIQAKQELRPIVICANVANPVNLGLYLWSLDTYNMFFARCADYSTVISNVCAEFVDPGIIVADIRTAIALAPVIYGQLNDATGATVEISSGTGNTGDGTHPHAIGERLIIGAHLDALTNANLPRGRGALPFAPARSLAYARSSGG